MRLPKSMRNFLRWREGREGRRRARERARAEAARREPYRIHVTAPALQQAQQATPGLIWGNTLANTILPTGASSLTAQYTYSVPPDPWAPFTETPDPEADFPPARHDSYAWWGQSLYCAWMDEEGKETPIGPDVPKGQNNGPPGFKYIEYQGGRVYFDEAMRNDRVYFLPATVEVDTRTFNPRRLGVITNITDPTED